VYRFEWTPIITFGVRRLNLLQWMEDNLDPVAFSDTRDHIGVALLNKDIRMVVHRSGMVLEDAVAADVGVSSLIPAIEGIWPVLSPKSAVLRSASMAWSFELEGVDYNEARAWFARQASGVSAWPMGFRAIDASALMDLEGPNFTAQVEWGVVSKAELADRLTDPEAGRMSSNRPAARTSSVHIDALAPTSLFVDLTIEANRSDVISDTSGIEAAIQFVDTVGTSIASSLRDIAVRETGSNT
jgi:hypothetical protein